MTIKSRLAKLEKQQDTRPRGVGQFNAYTDAQHNRAMDTLAEAMREEIISKLDNTIARYEAGELDTAQPVNLSPLAQDIARRLDAIAEVQNEQANK